MRHSIEIIDPEYERAQSLKRRALFLAALVGLCILGYPEVKDFSTDWGAMRAGRKFALYLSMLKSRAILNKVPLEARFRAPDLIEVSEVSSCGPNATQKKLWTAHLSDFSPDIQFAPEVWVRQNAATREPVLPRFCYDPLFGSSVFADGLAHGSIFIAHEKDIANSRGDHVMQIMVEGASADLTLETN
mgnify:CR=1 FL=1